MISINTLTVLQPLPSPKASSYERASVHAVKLLVPKRLEWSLTLVVLCLGIIQELASAKAALAIKQLWCPRSFPCSNRCGQIQPKAPHHEGQITLHEPVVGFSCCPGKSLLLASRKPKGGRMGLKQWCS